MRRISVLFAVLAICTCVRGQISIQVLSPADMLRRHREEMARIQQQIFPMIVPPLPEAALSVRAWCEPATPVVGERCDLILELDFDNRVNLENYKVLGLPQEKGNPIVYGATKFVNLNRAAKSAMAGRVVQFKCLPMRFLAPLSAEVSSLRIKGQAVAVGGSLYSFDRLFAPLRFEARPLPEEGRPANFSGAVGKYFSIKQSLNRDHVRPNDLIKVTYTLEFDDYCPTNVFPNIEHLSKKHFTAYPLKEVERKEGLVTNRVTWTQELVPRTAQATNTAHVSFNYYNPRTKRYETAHADPLPLVFVSTEMASTENTSVAVTEPAEVPVSSDDADAETATQPVVLRFAPSDGSPVIAKLPPGTPVKELATWNGWRRLETPRAIGWEKARK